MEKEFSHIAQPLTYVESAQQWRNGYLRIPQATTNRLVENMYDVICPVEREQVAYDVRDGSLPARLGLR